MPRLERHLLATTLTVCAVAFTGGSAQAAGVTVTTPQTPLPELNVTAPGTNVTVGPGGASATVDPQKAVGDLTGSPPGGSNPPPPATSGGGDGGASSTASPQQPPAGGGSRETPGGGNAAPGSGAGSRPAAGGATAPSGTPSRTSTRTRQGTGTEGPRAKSSHARRRSASPNGEQAAHRSIVTRIIEKVPTELLVALLVTALIAAAMSLVWLRERGRVRVARRQAHVDPLTGIPNRLAFERGLAGEWKRARRYGRSLGVLLLDLDGLKRTNDRDGHEAGDRMIRAAATSISGDVRQSDLAARLAGDEFVVLCPETSRPGLEQLAAKLSYRLAEEGIGASIGWAELTGADVAPGDLLARADAAMYREKEQKARRRGRPGVTARPGFASAG